jgi:hypothetical protein
MSFIDFPFEEGPCVANLKRKTNFEDLNPQGVVFNKQKSIPLLKKAFR